MLVFKSVLLVFAGLCCVSADAGSARDVWFELVGKKLADRPAFAFVEPDPALPNVLIYGDSISIGYTPQVRERLDGCANVFRLHCNGGPSGSFIEKMSRLHDTMRDPELEGRWEFDWDVIYFNVGLHDLKYVNGRKLDKKNGTQVALIQAYQANLRDIVAYLKQVAPHSQLVFATTTPVPEGSAGRVAGDAQRYNAAAHQVLQAFPEVIINDLFLLTQGKQGQWATKPGNVHFNDAGQDAQAQAVAEVIQEVLAASTPLRILPVGDSITAGNHAGKTANYRFHLENLLREHGADAAFYGIDGRQRGNHTLQDRDNAGFGGADIARVRKVLAAQRTSGPGTARFTTTVFDEQAQDDVVQRADSVDLALALVGTNEFDTVVPAGQNDRAFFEARYRKLFTFFQEEGIPVIFATVPPVALGKSEVTDTPEKVHQINAHRFPVLNTVLRALAPEFDGVTLVDHTEAFRNAPADQPLIHTDGIHLTDAGQRLLAEGFYQEMLRRGMVAAPGQK